jgi:hypothetical protein
VSHQASSVTAFRSVMKLLVVSGVPSCIITNVLEVLVASSVGVMQEECVCLKLGALSSSEMFLPIYEYKWPFVLPCSRMQQAPPKRWYLYTNDMSQKTESSNLCSILVSLLASV